MKAGQGQKCGFRGLLRWLFLPSVAKLLGLLLTFGRCDFFYLPGISGLQFNFLLARQMP
jgi:hypothetical protein